MREIVITGFFPKREEKEGGEGKEKKEREKEAKIKKVDSTIYVTPVVGSNESWYYCIYSKEPFAYDDPPWIDKAHGDKAKRALSQPEVLGLNIFSHNYPNITLDEIIERLKTKNSINQVDYNDREGVDGVLSKIEEIRGKYAKTQTIEQKAG